jgi:hypothetical protein
LSLWLWQVDNDGTVSSSTSSALSQHAKRMLAEADRGRVHLLVLYAIVARDARVAQDLIAQNPTFFGYIQVRTRLLLLVL